MSGWKRTIEEGVSSPSKISKTYKTVGKLTPQSVNFQETEIIELIEGQTILGRAINLPVHPSINRKHVEIWISTEGPIIMASRRGLSSVNVLRLTSESPISLDFEKPTLLYEGDQLVFLDGELKFTLKLEKEFTDFEKRLSQSRIYDKISAGFTSPIEQKKTLQIEEAKKAEQLEVKSSVEQTTNEPQTTIESQTTIYQQTIVEQQKSSQGKEKNFMDVDEPQTPRIDNRRESTDGKGKVFQNAISIIKKAIERYSIDLPQEDDVDISNRMRFKKDTIIPSFDDEEKEKINVKISELKKTLNAQKKIGTFLSDLWNSCKESEQKLTKAIKSVENKLIYQREFIVDEIKKESETLKSEMLGAFSAFYEEAKKEVKRGEGVTIGYFEEIKKLILNKLKKIETDIEEDYHLLEIIPFIINLTDAVVLQKTNIKEYSDSLPSFEELENLLVLKCLEVLNISFSRSNELLPNEKQDILISLEKWSQVEKFSEIAKFYSNQWEEPTLVSVLTNGTGNLNEDKIVSKFRISFLLKKESYSEALNLSRVTGETPSLLFCLLKLQRFDELSQEILHCTDFDVLSKFSQEFTANKPTLKNIFETYAKMVDLGAFEKSQTIGAKFFKDVYEHLSVCKLSTLSPLNDSVKELLQNEKQQTENEDERMGESEKENEKENEKEIKAETQNELTSESLDDPKEDPKEPETSKIIKETQKNYFIGLISKIFCLSTYSWTNSDYLMIVLEILQRANINSFPENQKELIFVLTEYDLLDNAVNLLKEANVESNGFSPSFTHAVDCIFEKIQKMEDEKKFAFCEQLLIVFKEKNEKCQHLKESKQKDLSLASVSQISYHVVKIFMEAVEKLEEKGEKVEEKVEKYLKIVKDNLKDWRNGVSFAKYLLSKKQKQEALDVLLATIGEGTAHGRLNGSKVIFDEMKIDKLEKFKDFLVKLCLAEPDSQSYNELQRYCKSISVEVWNQQRTQILLELQGIALKKVPKGSTKTNPPQNQVYFSNLKGSLEIFISEGQHPYITQLNDFKFFGPEEAFFITQRVLETRKQLYQFTCQNLKPMLLQCENFDELIKLMLSCENSRQDANHLVSQKLQQMLGALTPNDVKQHKQVAKWMIKISQIYANNNIVPSWKLTYSLMSNKFKHLTNFWNTLPSIVENPIIKRN